MLLERILQKKAIVGVVGLGYVGLPLALVCGLKGYRVRGIDNNKQKVKEFHDGKYEIEGVAAEKLKTLLDKEILQIFSDYKIISNCDIIFICVQTPLQTNEIPDYSYLFQAVEGIAAHLHQEQLIIVESTVTPGTTIEDILPRLEAGGLKVGQNFYLAFSPERIDPANVNYNLENIPKLVSGVTQDCRALAEMFYAQIGITTVSVSAPVVAEMAKLLENTYRDVNIAFINEMAEFCRRSGINVWEVIEVASSKPFGFQPFYPGPGVGGHCIPKDSSYYIYLARRQGFPALLAEQARKINALRPSCVVGRLKEALAAQGLELSGAKILFLGVTYKKDVNDIRESPTIKIMEMIIAEGAIVSYHDPYIKNVRVGDLNYFSINLHKEAVAQQDCVVMAVPHSNYNLAWISENSPFIFDFTNAMTPFSKMHKKIIKL